jgi:hypothetical protein
LVLFRVYLKNNLGEKMDIPQNCQNALEKGIQQIGSASAELKPSHSFAHGARINLEDSTIRVFVCKDFCQNLIKDCENTKRAVFYSTLFSHEAYQVKGNVICIEPLSERDISISKEHCEQFIQATTEMGMAPENTRKIFGRAADTTITIELEQIFEQTPGPQAGKPISL